MNTILKFLTPVLICLLVQAARAQQDSSWRKEQFKISINYNSHLNYYGRTDSLRSSGVFPQAEIWFSPQFYISAAPIFVNNAVTSFDYAGTVATAGFQHISDKTFFHAYLIKPFYESGSALVQSALTAQTGINISLLNSVVNLTMGGDLKFSDEIDPGATAGLDHLFRITLSDNSLFIVNPSAYAYAGTQQFTKTYYTRGNLILLPNQQTTESVKKFNVLAYEFSMPLIWTKGRFQVLLTPSYILPQHLLVVEGRPDLSERGKNMIYSTASARLSF